MAKLPRVLQKIFGSSAGANQIAKFGSLQAGSPSYTTDPAVVQSLSNYLVGWFNAVIGNNSPAIEDMNSLFFMMTYQLAYLFQAGVSEWDSGTTYYTGSIVNDGTGKLYKSIQDTNLNHLVSDGSWWTIVTGGSGSGGINYIVDGDFEASGNGITPTGWAAYAGGTTTPTSGTGGSPNAAVTFLTSNVSPIRGLMSAVFTKDAANRQGQGWSKAFTIAAPDRSKKCQLKVELDASTNFVAGDVAFYIYDVTNSVLITPSTAAIPKLTNGSWNITFDSSTSLSYRLIMHIATTSALAYTLKVDTFIVNAESLGSSNPGGPWTSFPLISNNTGSKVFTNSGRWRRVNDSMEFEFNLSGNATASGGGASQVSMSMPTGYTIDVNSLPGALGSDINNVGFGFEIGITGATAYTGLASILPLNASSIGFILPASGGFITATSINVARAVQISGKFTVPIAEWAGQTMANGAGAQVEYAFSTETFANTGVNTTYGPQGQITANLAGTFKQKTITWQTPVSTTSQIAIELSYDQITWFDSALFAPYMQSQAGSNLYGVMVTSTTATTTTLQFNGYRIGATDDAPQVDWAAGTLYWRARKFNPSSPVGIKTVNSLESGLSTPSSPQIDIGAQVTGTGWTSTRCRAIAYSDSNGVWRVRFNIAGSVSASARTSYTATLAGVTFPGFQALCGITGATGVPTASYTGSGNGSLVMEHASATSSVYVFSGDVEVTAKPSWA